MKQRSRYWRGVWLSAIVSLFASSGCSSKPVRVVECPSFPVPTEALQPASNDSMTSAELLTSRMKQLREAIAKPASAPTTP